MARYKDLSKTMEPVTVRSDGYINVDEYSKGSVGGSIILEPAIIERRVEPTYADLLIDLQEIKRDIQKLKVMVEDMNEVKETIQNINKNGLKMKPNW